jgi:polyribonucleotide nucleotidyltransferase
MKKRKLKSNGGVTFSKNINDFETSVSLTNKGKVSRAGVRKNNLDMSITNISTGLKLPEPPKVKKIDLGINTKKGRFGAYSTHLPGRNKPVEYGLNFYKKI